MATVTPRMPVEFSDSLDLALFREARDQTSDGERLTCPVHLDWRDHCRSLH